MPGLDCGSHRTKESALSAFQAQRLNSAGEEDKFQERSFPVP